MGNAHSTNRPERIGHRGAPREFDENTVPGFRRAVERGADAVELDVHLTRDGAVVVHHDDDVAGPDGVRTPIATLTADALKRITLPMGGTISTLAMVLDALGNSATVYIELKGQGVGPSAARVAREHGHRYAFHSFDHEAVYALRREWPDAAYGVLLDRGRPDALRVAATAPVRDIWAHWSLVDEALVAAAHAAGKRVVAWTVNDAVLAKRLASLGVDGLCGDDVRELP